MTGILVYAGSGAVGTSTCAAATGIALARDGTETAVVSFDPIHSLSEALETEIGPEPTVIREGLTAVEMNPEAGQETYSDLFQTLSDTLEQVGIGLDDGHVADIVENQRIPLGREVAALEAVASFVQDPHYETVVFDTGPNGKFLRLLRKPGLLGQGVVAAQDATNLVERAAADARSRVPDPFPWGDEGNADSTEGGETKTTESEPRPAVDEEIERRVGTVRSVIGGAGRRQLRVVTTPEEVSVRYTDYLVTNVNNAGIPSGPLIVNQVLEDVDEDCARCRAQRREHRRILAELETKIGDLDLCTLPDCRGEYDGVEMLEQLSEFVPT